MYNAKRPNYSNTSITCNITNNNLTLAKSNVSFNTQPVQDRYSPARSLRSKVPMIRCTILLKAAKRHSQRKWS